MNRQKQCIECGITGVKDCFTVEVLISLYLSHAESPDMVVLDLPYAPYVADL